MGRENIQNAAEKGEERPADENPRGSIRRRTAEDFCHSTNRRVSMGVPPNLLRILKSPFDADWSSSSAIFTVCRRIDLSMREHPACARTESAAHGLRLCVHINRDNRGSPGAAYRVGDSGGGGGGVHGDAGLAKGVLLGDSACKWSAFIVRRARRMNM